MLENNKQEGGRAPSEEKNPEGCGSSNKSIKYCVNCGATVNDTAIYCGECGYNLKTTRNESTNNHNQNNIRNIPPKKELDWKIIGIGGLISFGLSFLFTIAALFFLIESSFYTVIGVFIVINLSTLFIGALFAGGMAKTNGATHGMYACLVTTGIAFLLDILFGISIDMISIWIAIMLAIGLGGLGGFIGSKIRLLAKPQQMPATNPYYV